jgi:recombination associated protein RdgC
MGILSGQLTVRRYTVDGEVPEGFRDKYVEALNAYAFKEPFSKVKKEPVEGWCQVHNLLETDFTDLNLWLYNHYALFALRIDQKVLPAKLFRATFEKRVKDWCAEHDKERCPRSAKEELKEQLEIEMLKQTLPRVQVFEAVWNLAEGWVLFHNQSTNPNDSFRKLFLRTFGLKLIPQNPLEMLDEQLAAAMERTGGSNWAAI